MLPQTLVGPFANVPVSLPETAATQPLPHASPLVLPMLLVVAIARTTGPRIGMSGLSAARGVAAAGSIACVVVDIVYPAAAQTTMTNGVAFAVLETPLEALRS